VTTLVAEIVGSLLLVVAMATLVRYRVTLSRELRLARHETSRFPLFAVRHELVKLIALGVVAENEPGWRNAYREVNFLLRMDQQLNMLHVLTSYIRSQMKADTDPKYKERLERRAKIERETAAAHPEFKMVVDRLPRAFMAVVVRRTTFRHRLAIRAIGGICDVIGTVAPHRKKMARAVQRSVTRPSRNNLSKWQLVNEENAAAA
jgi:hypothetical protein